MSEEEKEIEKKISKELEPFLDGLRTMGSMSRNFKLFKEAYNYSQDKLDHAVDIIGMLLRAKIEKPINELHGDVIELFKYMGFVESLGNSTVNMIVMLLVANGRDFHIECRYTTPRIKHAVSIKDLEKERIPLGTKLRFLDDNGITELAKIIDSELRNDIAHLKFDVRQGRLIERQYMVPFHVDRIYVKGKLASEVASSSSRKLLHAVSTTLDLVEQLAKEKGLTKKREG